MGAIFGARGIGDWAANTERPTSYHDVIFKQAPDIAPFLNLTSKLPKGEVKDFVYNIFEEPIVVQYVTTTGSHDNSTTTINLAGSTPAKNLRAGLLLRNERTDEILHVAADPASAWTSFTSGTRGAFGTAAASMNSGDVLRIIGSLGVELRTAVTARSDSLSVVTNYLQDFEESAEISDWSEDMEIRPKSEKAWAREKRRSMERFKVMIEEAFFWGRKLSTTVSSKQAYATGGLKQFVTTNVFDDSSTGTSLDRIEDVIQALGKYGSATKWAFAGAGAITRINRIIRNNANLNFDMSEPIDRRQTWGLNVRNMQTPHLELQLIKSHLLTESAVGTNMLFVVDPKYVKLAQYDSKIGPIRFDDDIKKDDGYTGRKGRWRGVLGLMLGQEMMHGIWTVGAFAP